MTLELVQLAVQALRAHDIDVVLTRDGDSNLGLVECANVVRDRGADPPCARGHRVARSEYD